jgi:RNA polymerase sigma-70 factor (ECF subfamily)
MVVGSLVVDGTEGVIGVRSEEEERARAFRELIDLRLEEAYRLAAFILADPSEAEDAVHDAALAAWRHRTDLRDPDRSSAWFRRIVVNTCRDRLRARKRSRVVDVGLRVADERASMDRDPGDALAARSLVAAAVERLDPDERIVVALRYGLDLTVPAIAATCSLPEGTVKSRLHRALGKLEETLREEAP